MSAAEPQPALGGTRVTPHLVGVRARVRARLRARLRVRVRVRLRVGLG